VIRRIGGTEDIPINVRVISATLRDLRAEVNAGTFRLDLYYRLAVVLLHVAPLRDRASDIPLLVEHFLREAGYEGPRDALFPQDRMLELEAHRWPGNVRELRNIVDAVLATGEDPMLDTRAPETAAPETPAPGSGERIGAVLHKPYREARGEVLHEFERRYLTHLLSRSGGNVRGAAREARMDRTYLIELLRRHDLPAAAPNPDPKKAG
jgi:DNA-binding NtrC family response regulator